jgi:hypothetical protein
MKILIVDDKVVQRHAIKTHENLIKNRVFRGIFSVYFLSGS